MQASAPPAYTSPYPHGAHPSADDRHSGDDRHSPDAGDREQTHRTAEYESAAGVPGRGVVLASLLAWAVAVVVDIALTGKVTLFFDLWFIVVCLVGAMSVRRADLFTTGVLPPLAFAVVIGVIAVTSPSIFVNVGDLGKAFFSGLAQHAGALVAGYSVALVTVGGRVSTSRGD